MNAILSVGINVYPDKPLHGCVNDANDMSAFVAGEPAFRTAKRTILTDAQATKYAISSELNRMFQQAETGDLLVFHFSGHGTRLFNDGQQHDAICPFDFSWDAATNRANNALDDDDLATIFSAIPAGVRLTWVADSCYAGGYVQDRALALLAGQPRIWRFLPPPAGMVADLSRVQPVRVNSFRVAIGALNVIMLAACGPNELAADSAFGDDSRPNGAFTYYTLQEFQSSGGTTETASLVATNVAQRLLDNQFSQMPAVHGNRNLFARTPLS